MRASSTSSSDAPARRRRSLSRPRTAIASAALTTAAFLAALPFAHTALVDEALSFLDMGIAADSAISLCGKRPLLAFVGSSQTRRSVDALTVERRLFGEDPAAPFVANLGVDGVHGCMGPALLRRLGAHAALDMVVLELGHVSNDQYRGVYGLRDYLEDETVRRAFLGTPRGVRFVELWEEEHLRPWNGVARTGRMVVDQRARLIHSEFRRESMERSRGWSPTDVRKSREQVLAAAVTENPSADPVLDASPQEAFLAAARICAEECAQRNARFAVLVQPVNRDLAAELRVLRHFERTARERTVPALTAAGIDVLLPPDRFWQADRFSDHVHLHRDAVGEFTSWVAERLAELRARR